MTDGEIAIRDEAVYELVEARALLEDKSRPMSELRVWGLINMAISLLTKL